MAGVRDIVFDGDDHAGETAGSSFPEPAIFLLRAFQRGIAEHFEESIQVFF